MDSKETCKIGCPHNQSISELQTYTSKVELEKKNILNFIET